jgi:acyl carrier protein
MSDGSLFDKIARIIGERLMIDPARITRETTADDVDGWDSITHSLLMLEVERQLGVTLATEQMFDLENVGDLVDLVADARGAA